MIPMLWLGMSAGEFLGALFIAFLVGVIIGAAKDLVGFVAGVIRVRRKK